MLPQPILQTQRLLLRPFVLSDVSDVQRLVSAPEIAATTANIPQPYPDGMAEQWIVGRAAALENETHVAYAMTLR